MKIAIVGQSGGGKTTLGKFLAKRYGKPFLEVDTLLHQRDFFRERDERERSRIRREVKEEIDAFRKKPDWVIDNNHQSLNRKQIIQDADKVIFFDFTRYARLTGNLRRHMRREKRIHRFWTYHLPRAIRYHRRRREEIVRELSGVRPKVTVIRSRTELARYVDRLTAQLES